MDREQAIETAQSALRLRHGVTHTGNGALWTWRKFGWKIVMSESGVLISCIDEWSAFRTVA